MRYQTYFSSQLPIFSNKNVSISLVTAKQRFKSAPSCPTYFTKQGRIVSWITEISLIYEELVELARNAVAAERTIVLALVDEMANLLWCTYSPASNITYLVGMEGKIVEK